MKANWRHKQKKTAEVEKKIANEVCFAYGSHCLLREERVQMQQSKPHPPSGKREQPALQCKMYFSSVSTRSTGYNRG